VKVRQGEDQVHPDDVGLINIKIPSHLVNILHAQGGYKGRVGEVIECEKEARSHLDSHSNHQGKAKNRGSPKVGNSDKGGVLKQQGKGGAGHSGKRSL